MQESVTGAREKAELLAERAEIGWSGGSLELRIRDRGHSALWGCFCLSLLLNFRPQAIALFLSCGIFKKNEEEKARMGCWNSRVKAEKTMSLEFDLIKV